MSHPYLTLRFLGSSATLVPPLTLLSLFSLLIPFSSPHAAMNASNTLIFQISDTERARITTAGISTTGSVNANTFIGDGSNLTNLPTTSLPTGAITAFDLTTCPTGWSEYIPARGRFLRGIDNGAGNDPAGTRIPGNIQDATRIQQSADVWQGIIGFANADGTYAETYAGQRHAQASSYPSAGPNSSIAVRPKNVAVLFCRKN